MGNETAARWKSLPAQIIRVDNSVILKRGCMEIRLDGNWHAERLRLLLESAEHGATQEDILSHFSEAERPEVLNLLELLRAKHIVTLLDSTSGTQETTEEPRDIFYWHFEPQARAITSRLRSRRIVILGANSISRRLSAGLELSGFEDIALVQYPERGVAQSPNSERPGDPNHLRDGKLPIPYERWLEKVEWQHIDCLIATSDIGGRDLMREWNELAVRHRCHFLPVILQNAIGYVGPVVVPGETACYECLVSRENSHLDDPLMRRAVERCAFEGQHVAAFHPLMATILGDIAAFEVMRAYSEVVVLRRFSTLIEVNLLSSDMTTRKVLRIPRCLVCSELHRRPSVSIHKDGSP